MIKITEDMIDKGVKAFRETGSMCKTIEGERIMVEEVLCATLGIVLKPREIKNPEYWFQDEKGILNIQSFSEYLQSLRKDRLFL